MRPRLFTLIGVAVVSLAAPARGEVALGYVVRIDAKGRDAEVYIDLGVERGATEGARVTLLRDITVRHPVTKRPLRDLFPVAEAKIDNARGTMSILRVPAPIASLLRPGDRAALGDAPPPLMTPAAIAAAPGPAGRLTPCPTPKEKTCPACAAAPPREIDPATQAVLRAWRATVGQTPSMRIALWKDFERRFPTSQYAAFARDEVARLYGELGTRERLRGATADAATAREALARLEWERRAAAVAATARHDPPVEVRRDEPIAIAVAVTPRLRAVLLHYRDPGSPHLTTVRLHDAGDGYLSGTIPAAAVTGRRLAYTLETVDAEGQRHLGTGGGGEPVQVAVRDNPREVSLADRSRITLRSDYVDFNSFRRQGGADYYWVLEGDFSYRFRTILHAMNMGFGTYNGEGGTFNKQNQLVGDPRTVGFNYAYVGLEFRFHEYFSVITRVLAGLNADGLAGGFEGRIRIGREEGTNLVLAAQTTQNIGTLAYLQLTWDVVRNFPMAGSVEVTDQPAQGDIGVRFSYDLGWRALRWWYPSVRVSFQARTIDHYGFGVGLASTFAW